MMHLSSASKCDDEPGKPVEQGTHAETLALVSFSFLLASAKHSPDS